MKTLLKSVAVAALLSLTAGSAYADKIIFNSISQLQRFESKTKGMVRGLRLNPGFSTSDFDLADPARKFSRLGEWDVQKLNSVADQISGVMIHYNCENE